MQAPDDTDASDSNISPIGPSAADTARETALEADAARAWQGTPLQPWSEGRRRLLDQLCAADVPMPHLASASGYTFIQGYFPRAVKALYIAHHKDDYLLKYRSQLLGLSESWGLTNVPDEPWEAKQAAVNFVLEMEEAHRQFIALQRAPKTTAKDLHAGN